MRANPSTLVPFLVVAAGLLLSLPRGPETEPLVPSAVSLFTSRDTLTDQTLRGAFVDFLAGDPDNPAASVTADFLRTRPLRVALKDPGSPRVLAEYFGDS